MATISGERVDVMGRCVTCQRRRRALLGKSLSIENSTSFYTATHNRPFQYIIPFWCVKHLQRMLSSIFHLQNATFAPRSAHCAMRVLVSTSLYFSSRWSWMASVCDSRLQNMSCKYVVCKRWSWDLGWCERFQRFVLFYLYNRCLPQKGIFLGKYIDININDTSHRHLVCTKLRRWHLHRYQKHEPFQIFTRGNDAHQYKWALLQFAFERTIRLWICSLCDKGLRVSVTLILHSYDSIVFVLRFESRFVHVCCFYFMRGRT